MFLTSALLVAGFSVLFLSNFQGIVHVNFLMCVILISALLGDPLLLPALLLTFRPAEAPAVERRAAEPRRSTPRGRGAPGPCRGAGAR